MQVSASVEQRRQELHAPLLGDEEACCSLEHFDGHDGDDEDEEMMLMSDGNDNDHNDDGKNTTMTTATAVCCNDTVIIWIILPCLLLSQFGMAFVLHDESTAHLSWPICNFSIFLFCVTAWLFRHACADHHTQQQAQQVSSDGDVDKNSTHSDISPLPVLLLLAPEICMDIILALVLFNQVELGFVAMLISMLLLSGFVVVTTADYLYCRHRRRRHQHKDAQEEQQQEVQEEEEEEETVALSKVYIV
jgi:hypothetical protein